MKCCTKCGIEKNLVEFNKDRQKKDGLQSWCRSCCRLSYRDNQEARLARAKQYGQENKAKRAVYMQGYYQKTKNERHAYQRQQRKTNPSFKLANYFRSRLNKVLKGKIRKGNIEHYLGATVNEVKQYLEAQWLEDMDWSNHTKKGWHIDHIIPLAVFDLEDEEQRKKAFHYTNLQPLWAEDNFTKGTKI